MESYVDINRALWAAVERGELQPEGVRVARFDRLISKTGIDADATELSEAFAHGLRSNGELYPGARAVLEQLSAQSTLALVTNGFSDIQRGRVERLGLASYFDTIAISAEIGFAKPSHQMFDAVFERLGWPDPDTALMVGDSLTSDMAGGVGYGISTCWYNPHAKPADPSLQVTYTVARLEEIPSLTSR